MATKWNAVRKTLASDVEARIRKNVEDAAEVMTLNQIREARSLTQVTLANTLKINQGAVSKMEKRTDMYLSTMRSYIQAMGGQLQIRAVFPEGEIQIEQFGNEVGSHQVKRRAHA
jgi:DNA-binding XRE family transcriptional regulator